MLAYAGIQRIRNQVYPQMPEDIVDSARQVAVQDKQNVPNVQVLPLQLM